jgi:hypothetical protein
MNTHIYICKGYISTKHAESLIAYEYIRRKRYELSYNSFISKVIDLFSFLINVINIDKINLISTVINTIFILFRKNDFLNRKHFSKIENTVS